MSIHNNPAGLYRVFSLIAAAFVICLSMSCNKPNLPGGDEKNFDCIASLPAVANFAGSGSILTQISANFVRPDGKVDLSVDYADERDLKKGVHWRPIMIYGFVIPHEIQQTVEKDDRPLGAGGGQPLNMQDYYIPWAYNTIYVRVPATSYGRVTSSSSPKTTTIDYDPGMTSQGIETINSDNKEARLRTIAELKKVVKPPVHFSTVWQWAIKAGAPSDNAVAKISYYPAGENFRVEYAIINDAFYEFEIYFTDYKYRFGLNGELLK